MVSATSGSPTFRTLSHHEETILNFNLPLGQKSSIHCLSVQPKERSARFWHSSCHLTCRHRIRLCDCSHGLGVSFGIGFRPSLLSGMSLRMDAMNPVCDRLAKIGKKLKFEVKTEVQASESAWVDLVWFDSRLPIPNGKKSFNMRYAPVLPVVGFEIELHTGLNAKHVKGSVSNLSNLGAQLGVIVIGESNLTALKKQPAHANKIDADIQKMLCDRVYRWVYAEAQPKGRIVVMFENEVNTWAEGLGVLSTLNEVATVPVEADTQHAETSPV
jgi:hypothetical protein